MSLEKQIALVTGASRGIGKAILEELGNQGAVAVGTATSPAGAESITANLNSLGLKGCGKVLDVTDPESVTAVVESVQSEFGSISILVNNAGITRDNLLMRMKEDEWDGVIQTNLTSVYRMSKACLRGMMKARSGRIITITSVIGATGNPGQTNYAATKAGAAGFSRSLAREVGSRGITVNTVAPGFIDTDMTRILPEKQRDALQEQIALGRLGDVRDVANAVAFLASDAAAYITGETLHVNGGIYMS
ncbi:MAG TPA: 3-oxoacyl-ACP reductase FabG [Gammaproteobacteria bacterium]|nr:3-oxoacyl-ACP reductase FabG [Gammaproteobacteria bacterium]